MGKLNASPPLGEKEAREITERIRAGLESVRVDLHTMYVGRGYLALGYKSFSQWLESEYDVHYSYLYRQTHAALLEDELDVPIGTHLESHLRPLIEILDESERVAAYNRVHNGRTAKDYKVAAMETYILNHAHSIIQARYEAGLISLTAAYEISKLIDGANLTSANATLLALTSDPELAGMLLAMSRRGGETWQEILYSRTIPAFPDPIPIDKATAANLRAWLDVSSAEHKAQAVEGNREKYDSIKALTNRIIEVVKEMTFVKLSGHEIEDKYWQLLDDLISELDRVRSET